MKVPFYLLGLLIRYGPQHGYKLKQIVEERISDFAKIKLPTIYYHLDKLKEKGYVTETLDKDGNRPEKMVYCITGSGKKYFNELFMKQLEESLTLELPLDGVLYFMDNIGNDALLKELRNKNQEIIKKLDSLKKRRAITLRNIHEQGRFSAEAIFEHHFCHLEAEHVWLTKMIEGLST